MDCDPASSTNRYRPEVLREAPNLPHTFRFDSSRLGTGSRDGFDGIGGSVLGVICDVGGCSRVTGGARGKASRFYVCAAGSGVGREGGLACPGHWQLATRPSACRLNGVACAAVLRENLLKKRQNVLCAAGGPHGQ